MASLLGHVTEITARRAGKSGRLTLAVYKGFSPGELEAGWPLFSWFVLTSSKLKDLLVFPAYHWSVCVRVVGVESVV